jgi:hypothetical protein
VAAEQDILARANKPQAGAIKPPELLQKMNSIKYTSREIHLLGRVFFLNGLPKNMDS